MNSLTTGVMLLTLVGLLVNVEERVSVGRGVQ